jgi:hypothetical protein
VIQNQLLKLNLSDDGAHFQNASFHNSFRGYRSDAASGARSGAWLQQPDVHEQAGEFAKASLQMSSVKLCQALLCV